MRPIQFLLLTNHFDLTADRRVICYIFSNTKKLNVSESEVKRHITLETQPSAFYVVGTS